VLDILVNADWPSELLSEQQNPAERRWQTVEWMPNTIMDRMGSPPLTRILALQYVCFVCNPAASTTLKMRTPLQGLTVVTHDVSPLLCFSWWAPVYYANEDASFGSESSELRENLVGIFEQSSYT